MTQVLKPKVQASGIFDAFEMGIFKTLSERALTGVIGNSTLMSGGIKLVGGGIVNSVSKNKHVGLLSSAMVIDGVEDIAHTLLSGMLGGSGSTDDAGDF
jgi:hypothetical protein